MRDWDYQPAADLDRPMAERLKRFPREPDMLVYGMRLGSAILMRTWLASYHRLRIQGREHLPARGPYVLVANHASHLDAPCLLAGLPLRMAHRIFPVAAQDYFFVNLPRLTLATVAINAMPFDRQAQVRQSLRLCRQIMEKPEAGNVLMIFPEGTRSTNGELGIFQPGVGLLVAQTDWPVIPCHIAGAFDAWPKGCRLPRPRRVTVRLGRPRTYASCKRGKQSAEAIARDLRDAVLALAPNAR